MRQDHSIIERETAAVRPFLHPGDESDFLPALVAQTKLRSECSWAATLISVLRPRPRCEARAFNGGFRVQKLGTTESTVLRRHPGFAERARRYERVFVRARPLCPSAGTRLLLQVAVAHECRGLAAAPGRRRDGSSSSLTSCLCGRSRSRASARAGIHVRLESAHLHRQGKAPILLRRHEVHGYIRSRVSRRR